MKEKKREEKELYQHQTTGKNSFFLYIYNKISNCKPNLFFFLNENTNKLLKQGKEIWILRAKNHFIML